MTRMSGRAFVDTNVLVYAFDDADAKKRDAARSLLGASDGPDLVLSTQVLAEFYVVVTGKFAKPVTAEDAASAVTALARLPVVATDAALVQAAIGLSQERQLSLWDALIVEAAAVARCEILLTEDLDTGATIRGVRVENPFAES